MAKQLEQTTEQTTNAVEGMGLKLTDLIAGMVQATIDADQAVTDDYLATFTDYAFEKGPDGRERLRMVDFEMTDNEGVRRLVSIPRLSLLPLPVLHVSEATFDIEAQLYVMQSDSTTQDTGTGKGTLGSVPIGRVSERNVLSRTLRASDLQVVLQNNLDNKLSSHLRDLKTTGSKAEQTINARIHVELRPSTLPNGMRGALQVADTSIREVEVKEVKDKQ